MTTGRYQTRAELVEAVWHFWAAPDLKQADIARLCRVSPGVVATILKKGKP